MTKDETVEKGCALWRKVVKSGEKFQKYLINGEPRRLEKLAISCEKSHSKLMWHPQCENASICEKVAKCEKIATLNVKIDGICEKK